MKDARTVALTVMEDVREGAYLNLSMKKRLSALEGQERRFCARLVSATLENLTRIDYIIDWFTKGKRIHKQIRDILRLGVCQLVYFESVPVSAAVNESVKLAAASPKRQLKGFVNAVMHSAARDLEKVVYPDKSNVEEYISVMNSYPKWLVERYISEYGADFTEAMLSYKSPSMICVRANRLKITPEELDSKLSSLEAVKGKYISDARYIKNNTSIEEMPEYISGELTVQSESSMLAVEAADIKKGFDILDICAAPGGKSAYAAQKEPASILSCDIHPHRVELMDKNFERLGVCVETRVMDAAVPQTELYGCFDRVLVDAPCSALGLLYRKPDIKHSKKPEDTKSLAALQAEILETASRYVKKGGRLVYSTCTISNEENDENVDAFLARHSEFIEFPLSNVLTSLPTDRIKGGRVQFFPHLDDIDGFYIAVLERLK